MPAAMSRSWNPITPRPILRLPRTAAVISGSGYEPASMTLSRKRMASVTVSSRAAQSTAPACASQK